MSIQTASTSLPALVPASTTMRTVGASAVSLSGLYAQWLRGLTINAHERLAIAHLSKSGPMTMSELGSRIPLSRAAITALTDRLEALSYVVRTPDTQDRRRTVLSLTERPGKLMHDLTVPFTEELAEYEGGFDAAELEVIQRYHAGLDAVIERHATTLRGRSDEELPSPN